MNRNKLGYCALSLIVGTGLVACSSDDSTDGTGGNGGTAGAGGTLTSGAGGNRDASAAGGGGAGGIGAVDGAVDGAADVAVDRTLDAGDGAADSGDASVADGSDAKSDAGDGGDGSDGSCGPTQKSCGGVCVSKSDPLFGCTDTGCSSCHMVLAATCTTPDGGVSEAGDAGDGDASSGASVCSGACAPGYEDLDGLASNGCETKTPALIQMSNLQLWLRADRDMNCATDAGAADLAVWKDQSGKGHDATTPVTSTPGGAKPQCVDAATGIHGLPVARFVRSGDFTKDDGTLAVDLSYLAGADYTVFVVERRTDVIAGESWLLGTSAPGTDCTVTSNVQKAFRFGYRSNTELTVGQLCGGDLVATVAGADVTNKPVAVDVGWFSKTAVTGGHRVESGVATASDTAVVPIAAVAGGAIGGAT